jgi:hypothetical protein
MSVDEPNDEISGCPSYSLEQPTGRVPYLVPQKSRSLHMCAVSFPALIRFSLHILNRFNECCLPSSQGPGRCYVGGLVSLRKSILARQPVAATRLNYADEYLSESVRLPRERAESLGKRCLRLMRMMQEGQLVIAERYAAPRRAVFLQVHAVDSLAVLWCLYYLAKVESSRSVLKAYARAIIRKSRSCIGKVYSSCLLSRVSRSPANTPVTSSTTTGQQLVNQCFRPQPCGPHI